MAKKTAFYRIIIVFIWLMVLRKLVPRFALATITDQNKFVLPQRQKMRFLALKNANQLLYALLFNIAFNAAILALPVANSCSGFCDSLSCQSK